jgi:antitoxin YefM
MTIYTTYSQALADLISLWDEVVSHGEIVIVQRQGSEDVALIAANELTSLLETIHLLRSPVNAERLLTALHRAQQAIQPS